MNNHPFLKLEISQISIAERIQLADDLWDSILDCQDKLFLTDDQKQELDHRLENYQQDVTSGSSWDEVKRRLGVSR